MGERCQIGCEEQNEWYFFSHKDKKYPTGTRTNRATMAGFWKATGRDKAVYDKSKLIGMRKTLEEGWVVCRAFKKRITGQTKNMQVWESSYFYDEASGMSSVVDPIDYISRQNFLPQNLLCKKEADNYSNFVDHSDDQFVELPQLESPSLPLIKRPSSISEKTKHEEEDDEELNNSKKLTDWRALDKFVASQLSQEDRFEGEGIPISFANLNCWN
ncbi:hypothetical protein GOBAR_AA31808 [Gossypium barbadense]|uniref:NAC domain-containing protein n=1 Tax=Gossypium barbadense TaxID=3634 RepID=A0A2P5WCU0_GOSBA|nr:hypothetical protein GOBAR_AA31808 [Gossypium barbadense]